MKVRRLQSIGGVERDWAGRPIGPGRSTPSSRRIDTRGHERQDRRIDEAADPQPDGEGDETSKSDPECTHCFHRSCRVGHVTGSAWIVDMSGHRVLLARHRKLGR